MAIPDRYRLHVKVMDYQHEKLLKLVGELQAHESDLGAFLQGLAVYAEEHFRMEEALMEAHDYPARATHVEAHDELRRKFKGLSGEGLAGSPVARKAIEGFMLKWFDEHLGGVDRNLAEYLRDEGMTTPR